MWFSVPIAEGFLLSLRACAVSFLDQAKTEEHRNGNV